MNKLIQNEDAFRHLLTFLSLQDDVNLTNADIGYHNANHKINSELVKFCCRNCCFDNVAVQFNLCTFCIVSIDKYNSFRFISYDDANKLYKFSNKKLDIEILNQRADTKTVVELDLVFYDRIGIQEYVDSNFKSNRERLLSLYKKKVAKDKRDIVSKKKKEEKEREEYIRLEKEKREQEEYELRKKEFKEYLRVRFSNDFLKYANKGFLCDMYAKIKQTKNMYLLYSLDILM